MRRKEGMYWYELTSAMVKKTTFDEPNPKGPIATWRDWLNETIGHEFPVRPGIIPDRRGYLFHSISTPKGYKHFLLFSDMGDLILFKLRWV